MGFDPEIVIGPDWDFFIRFTENARIGFIRNSTCLYRIHTTNISSSVGAQKRRMHLARCREKAIQLKRFGECSLATRSFAFYDLLVNLLTGYPERQTEITRWSQFQDLPSSERARLYRLMASKALSMGAHYSNIGEWFQLSYRLNRSDISGALLSTLYQISPHLCKFILRMKPSARKKPLAASPFGDLLESRLTGFLDGLTKRTYDYKSINAQP